MIQRILITGGAGYIGSVLTRQLLSEGYDVTVVDNMMYTTQSLLGLTGELSFRCEVFDIGYPGLIAPLLDETDAVVHLAAIVGDPACKRREEEATRTNLEATKELYEESCHRGVKRFIFASTCSNYGVQNSDELVDEDGALRPLSHYAETKVDAEKFLLNGHTNGNGTITTILRLATIFGISSRNRFDLTINQFVKEALKDKHIEIWGEQHWRPYVHVRDAGKAIMSILEADSELVGGQVFNVGENGMNFRKRDIANVFERLIPEVEFSYKELPDDPRSYRVKFDKIKNTLGFSADMAIEDGIIELKEAIVAGRICTFEGKSCIN